MAEIIDYKTRKKIAKAPKLQTRATIERDLSDALDEVRRTSDVTGALILLVRDDGDDHTYEILSRGIAQEPLIDEVLEFLGFSTPPKTMRPYAEGKTRPTISIGISERAKLREIYEEIDRTQGRAALLKWFEEVTPE